MDLHGDQTRAILDELFRHPPVSLAELEQRLGPASANTARHALAERLMKEGDQLSDADGELLVHLFQYLGVGRESDVLLDLIADRARPTHARARALAILVHDKTDYSEAVRLRISDEEVLALATEPLCNLMAALEVEPAEAEELAEALEAAAPDLRAGLFERLEAHRRQVGTPAAVAYAQVLRRPGLSELRAPLLAALVEEGGRDAAALLEALRDEPAAQGDARLRRTLQGALLRLRTRALEGRSTAAGAGRAYISSCDGQGAYFLIGCRRNPDQSATLAMLCIRAAGDIRDGYVVPRQTPEQVEGILARITRDAHAEFAELTLARAAPIVLSAVDRTESLNLPLPTESLAAIRFFERVQPLEGHDAEAAPEPAPPPAGRVTLQTVRALLDRPAYRHSWFFDETDVANAGVREPRGPRPAAAWFAQAARALAERPLLVQRVLGTIEHMATWHRLRGETALANLCSTLAEATRRDFGKSPLVRVLLERFLMPLAPEESPARPETDPASDDRLGDPLRRRLLKARFLSDVREPSGRDLALLDLTEAAVAALEHGLRALPGEVQPREDRLHAAAFALSRLFRDFLLSDQPSASAVEQLSRAFIDTLAATCSLSPRECERISLGLLKTLTGFVDHVCGSCAVNCLGASRSDVAVEFFSTEHPAGRRISLAVLRAGRPDAAPGPGGAGEAAGKRARKAAPVAPRRAAPKKRLSKEGITEGMKDRPRAKATAAKTAAGKKNKDTKIDAGIDAGVDR